MDDPIDVSPSAVLSQAAAHLREIAGQGNRLWLTPEATVLIAALLADARSAWADLKAHNENCQADLTYPPDAAMVAALGLARAINKGSRDDG